VRMQYLSTGRGCRPVTCDRAPPWARGSRASGGPGTSSRPANRSFMGRHAGTTASGSTWTTSPPGGAGAHTPLHLRPASAVRRTVRVTRTSRGRCCSSTARRRRRPHQPPARSRPPRCRRRSARSPVGRAQTASAWSHRRSTGSKPARRVARRTTQRRWGIRRLTTAWMRPTLHPVKRPGSLEPMIQPMSIR
jgi:hypothetical protein